MENDLFFTAKSIHGEGQAKFPNPDCLLHAGIENLCNSSLRTDSMAAADHSYYLPHLNPTHFQITETALFPNSTHTTHKGKVSQELYTVSEPILGRKRKETPMSKSKAISPSPSSKSAKVEESSKRGKQKQKGLSENKPPEPPKGYIHVRARRGEATDSHSLAERVRREKISERMKLLQDLVPGCSKVTGKALMLDEIINYVQSLQNQVELLSMKLASVNFNPDLTLKNGGLPDSMYPPDSSAPTICRQQQGLSLSCNVPDREASLCSVDPNGRPQDDTDMGDLSRGCLLPQDDLQSIVQMAIKRNLTQKRALQR